jgi:uncharacterized SAM-binding protein YcdF (DUF218 family)
VARAGKLLVGFAGAGVLAFVAGFFAFASAVARYAPEPTGNADGIVVLTGGASRLSEAARLLTEGRGKRLLISGANHAATRADLFRTSGLRAGLFKCCVDVGYTAHDTSGNADETKAWAANWRFGKLIIVTSSYHMPRSLAELGRVMPEAELIPYPVTSRNLHAGRWWMDIGTARILLTEYVKFLPSAARLGVARLLMQWDGNAFAGGGARRINT